MNFRRIIAFLFFVLVLPGGALGADYIIGDGDVLDIATWGVKELSFSAKVRPDSPRSERTPP